jgi:GNAT superfamily N-acetyltransferase
VVALVESAYRGDRSRRGWTTEADLLDGQRTDVGQVTELLARPGSVVLVAEAGNRLLACCHLERRSDAAAYLGMFAVDPVRQGGGIGRAVMSEACRLAAEWGCGEMQMSVIAHRADLIGWYRRMGFEATGRTEPFPYGDERFGIPKRPDLEFCVLAKQLPEAAGGGDAG